MKPALFSSVKGYKLSNLGKDLMSGLLVAIIALPLSIALGIQSGVTLQQGLITAIVAGFVISILGGSKFQIGGPSATFVAIVVSYIADPQIGLLGMQFATVLAGIILIAMGIFKLGGLVKFVPFPIIIGFTSSIGLTLLVSQLSDFTSISISAQQSASFFGKIEGLALGFNTINLPTLTLGMGTLLIMTVLPKINKKIPSAFIAIIVATLITAVCSIFDPSCYGIQTIGAKFGEIKPEFFLPAFSEIGSLKFEKLIIPGIVIAFLTSIESLFSATVADNMTNTTHNANTELIAEGAANIASAMLGGLPATGAIARTATNVKYGAVSPISGIFHSVVLLLMFFVLMPLVSFVPLTALAGVLIMVSINMSNIKAFRKIFSFNLRDLSILLTTFILTLVQDLSIGVLGGLLVCVIVMAPDIFSRTKIIKIVDTPKGYERFADEITLSNVISVEGNLTFTNIHKLIKQCALNCDDKKTVIIDFKSVKRVDISTMERLAKLRRNLAKSGKQLVILNASDRISHKYFKAMQL